MITWPMAIYAIANAITEGFRFLQTDEGKQIIRDIREGRLEAERLCGKIGSFIEGLINSPEVARPAPRS